MERKIQSYIDRWKKQGYASGIPDEVPVELMKLQLAPSFKAIAIAVLKNDHSMKTLGFSGKKSKWYSVYKKIEITERNKKNNIIKDIQMELF